MCCWRKKGHVTPAVHRRRVVSGMSRNGSAGAMTGLKATLKSATVARDKMEAELAALRRDVRCGRPWEFHMHIPVPVAGQGCEFGVCSTHCVPRLCRPPGSQEWGMYVVLARDS